MENLGKVFKQIREARHISLAQAAAGVCTPSMLSKFETGNHDLSASKLLSSLANIHSEPAEFLYMVRGFQHSELDSFLMEIEQGSRDKHSSYEKLRRMYEIEQKMISLHQDFTLHMVKALLIKSRMRSYNESIIMTEQEETFFHDYLFDISFWGEFEIKFFAECSPLLPSDLFTMYTREMLHKSDYLGTLYSNRYTIDTLLLNGFLRCIGENDFINANYFDKQIHDHFYDDNQAYHRIIYMWAKGYYYFAHGEKSRGIHQMQQAVTILSTLGCVAAEYYKNKMKEILKQQ